MRDQEYEFIDYLKEKGVLSHGSIERVMCDAEESRELLGNVLLRLDLFSEEELLDLYVTYCELTVASEDEFPEVKLKILDIEEQFFSSFNVVVLSEDKNIIKLATSDPLDDFAKKSISYLTGKEVVYLVSKTSEVMRYYED